MKPTGILPNGKIYNMCWLTHSYFQDVLDLQELIYQSMADDDLFQTQTRDFLARQFTEEGKILGIIVDGNLVAFQVFHIPSLAATAYDQQENLGYDLGFEEEDLSQTIHIEISGIHPSYRGYNFYGLMIDHTIDHATTLGYRHLCATVSPKNYPSLVYILRHKYTAIVCIKQKYQKLRAILYRNLIQPALYEHKMYCPIEDINSQVKLLQRGLHGYCVCSKNRRLHIGYGELNV